LTGRQGIRVFGSLARGDDDAESDIDLLVELPGERTTGEGLLTVLALTDEFSSALGARVDVVTPRTLRDDVRDAAVAEAVPL
jgi:uncharacterized protein